MKLLIHLRLAGVLLSIIFTTIFTMGCKSKTEKAIKNTQMVKAAKPKIDTEKKADKKITSSTDSQLKDSLVVQNYFGTLPYTPITETYKIARSLVRPSVILIVIDAVNVKHLSTYGYERETSPNLTTLAKNGFVFANYVSNSSWTRPSFTTIITGLTKKQHKVELMNRDVDMGITTVAEHFRNAGYKTAGIVGNPLVRGVWGFNQGYQYYEDTASLKKAFPQDSQLTEKAINWINQVKGSPFFLKLFYTSSHAPYRPLGIARHFVEKIKKGEIVEYPFREYKTPMPKADHNKTVAAYDDEIRYADMQIGKLIKELKRLSLDENTAIIITADHAEMFGQHNCYVHAYHMWEEALRIPFVMYLPWNKTKGVMSEKLFSHVDVLPTLMEIAGIPVNDSKLTGKSILTTLKENKNDVRSLVSQYNAHGIRRQAARINEYKLIHRNKVSEEALKNINELHEDIPHADPEDLPSLDVDEETYGLYNLIDDPAESNNLFEKMKDSKIVKDLMELLKPEQKEKEETDSQMSNELIEALTSAGYMQKS
ncbi:MAG: sulfatase [Deltaproteobacteria bacterium]|nr:sulfatase [Deltaproteobacteria bacterium]